jgi:hypothetical protein
MTPRRITRRRFLILGGGTKLSAFMGGAYLKGGCPLSDSGVCVGPCAAFIDRNHDQICDRIQDSQAFTTETASIIANQSPSRSSQRVACPFGLVNDPYPGKCRRYVDRNGNGICDLSEIVEQTPAEEADADEVAPETGKRQRGQGRHRGSDGS